LSIILIVSVGISCITGYSQERQPDVYYVPTPEEVVMEMLQMAQVTQNDIVYDLGCGDGRIVITAAKVFGARGVGVDIDPVRIQESNENAQIAGVTDRVKFINYARKPQAFKPGDEWHPFEAKRRLFPA
jgi:predicted RNA methylase